MRQARALASRLFETLARETADPPGITRVTFGPGENLAHDLIAREAEAMGCAVKRDAMGNLHVTYPGLDPAAPIFVTGSHMDSVHHGGNYDGAAGVVAGLALIAALQEQGKRAHCDITVIAIRAEETDWFPALSYAGSLGLLGLLPPGDLDAKRSDSGQTLQEHMAELGLDTQAVARGAPQIDKARIGSFVEVHIEQGPRLLGEDTPLGLVTAINGGLRYQNAQAVGAYAHSGAVPRTYRQDAVLGFHELITWLESEWDRLEARGLEATITFGKVFTDARQHGSSKVAGEVAFALDIRSEYQEVLDYFAAALPGACAEIKARRGVDILLEGELTWEIAKTTPAVIDALERAARTSGIAARRMPSGAGHDAAVFANAGVPTGMLFIRNAGGSHNPHEAMELDDFMKAVAVLVAYVEAL